MISNDPPFSFFSVELLSLTVGRKKGKGNELRETKQNKTKQTKVTNMYCIHIK
jgi:hypothetical protein